MKKLPFLLSLFFCCSVAGAQSLSELAAKEKERRKSNAKAGKTSVVDIKEGALERRVRKSSGKTDDEPKRLDLRDIDTIARRLADVERRLDKAYERYNEALKQCRGDGSNGFGRDIPACDEKTRLSKKMDDLREERSALRKGYLPGSKLRSNPEGP